MKHLTDTIREGLKIGRDAAQQVAEHYHAAMAGYAPERHKAMDDDVAEVDKALTALSELERLAGEPVYWQWRRKGHDWTLEYTFANEVQVTTDDSERRALFAAPPAQQPQAEAVPHRPDVLEKLTYHALERDDMTLDDCLIYLITNGWHKVRGRAERELILQITALLAAAPPVQQPQAEAVIENTSDGYHTFKELYAFRKAYNAALFNEWGQTGKCHVHKSWRHHDGELCFGGGWFIVVAVLPDGQISNHYEAKDWELFNIPETAKALYEFDGHTGADVIARLEAYKATAPQQAEAVPSDVVRDAERYRWLRDENNDKGTKGMHIAKNLYGMEWDAAIDAAIAQQKGGV